eukprot:scaffold162_cov143-Skeletonema_menzelii.AAC.18
MKSLAKTSSSFDSLVRYNSIFDTNEGCIGVSSTSSMRMNRREILTSTVTAFVAASVPSASAANLPQSTGADLSKTGTIDTLIPIVAMKQRLESINSHLMSKSGKLFPDECKSILKALQQNIPRDENDFKRIFDSYSTPVSYKQKFLDQNAFLVYYTKGFDGPGRPNIENDTENSIQTLQYGARNDAWSAMDDFFVELDYGLRSSDSDAAELAALAQRVMLALDAYLSLAPVADVEQALASLLHR